MDISKSVRIMAYRISSACIHGEDVSCLVQVAAQNGIIASPQECYDAWDSYSDSMAAGWMHFPDDDRDLWWQLKPHLEIEEKY